MEGWQVMSQVETTVPNGAGGFTKGMQIGVTTTSGSSFTLFVPLAEYNAQHVKELIAARVAQISEVNALKAEG